MEDETQNINIDSNDNQEEQAPQRASQATPETGREKAGAPRMSGWKLAWIIVFFVAIGVCAGAVGGYLSARHEVNRLVDEVEDITDEHVRRESPGRDNYGRDFDDDDDELYDNNRNRSNSESEDVPEENTNKAALGIMVQDTDDGVQIVDFLSNTNAADSGLKVGDYIIRVDSEKVDGVESLRDYLSDKEPGDIVRITVKRNGKTQAPVRVQLIDNTEQRQHSDFPYSGNIRG